MRKFSILFWLVIIALGLTLYILGSVNSVDNDDTEDDVKTEETVEPTVTPTSSFKPTATSDDSRVPFEGFPDQSLVQEPPPHTSITGPATCSLSGGKITFLDQNTAIHDNAIISYENVDHPGRLIFWTSSPNDKVFGIGPNIFSALELPNGQENVNVVIEKGGLNIKTHTLKASINYGVLAKDGSVIRVEKVDCDGTVTVELDYL